jgi:hypothetical protein
LNAVGHAFLALPTAVAEETFGAYSATIGIYVIALNAVGDVGTLIANGSSSEFDQNMVKTLTTT